MRHETQVQLLRRFFEMRERHTTTLASAPHLEPTSVYTDPARAELELQRIFRRGPRGAGWPPAPSPWPASPPASPR